MLIVTTMKTTSPTKPPKLSATRMKIIDSYVRLGSYVETAVECKTNADHARRVVREHRADYQRRLAEVRDEDHALDQEERRASREARRKHDAWVDDGAGELHAVIDKLLESDNERIVLAAAKLKHSMRSSARATSPAGDEEREQRILAIEQALEGSGTP